MRVRGKIKSKDFFFFDSWMKIGFQSYGQNLILSKPGVSFLHATQCSDTICSGPALKIARSLCIVQIPGSNRLHTQSTMEYHNKGHFITRMIQSTKYFITYRTAQSWLKSSSGKWTKQWVFIISMQPQVMHVGCRLETTSEHLTCRRNSNLQQRIWLQRVGQNPLILASDF